MRRMATRRPAPTVRRSSPSARRLHRRGEQTLPTMGRHLFSPEGRQSESMRQVKAESIRGKNAVDKFLDLRSGFHFTHSADAYDFHLLYRRVGQIWILHLQNPSVTLNCVI